MNRQRFKQLYQLAHGGDMEARADLWLEFQFAFDHDPYPDYMQEPALPVSRASSLPCQSKAVGDQPIENQHSAIENTDLPQGGRSC